MTLDDISIDYNIMDVERITISGKKIILRPPLQSDLTGLINAAKDGEIWENPWAIFPNIQEMQNYLNNLLKETRLMLPFIIVLRESNEIIGSTRFFNIDHDNNRVEIGHTWISKTYRRTAVNTEAKFLMLQYAFEKLNCIAVEIRTDVLNEISRKAIERLGAKQDGILRNHKKMRKGRIRDTVCYSIIKEEWANVRGDLLAKMNKYPP